MNWEWLPINWEAVLAIITTIYTLLIFVTLLYVRKQVKEAAEGRTVQISFAIFNELENEEVRIARRYLYETVPEDIAGLPDEKVKQHLEACARALVAFDIVGYLLWQESLDPDPILALYWSAIWKCWKRGEKLIKWARVKRGDPTHLTMFQHLFHISDAHRQANEYAEPRFY